MKKITIFLIALLIIFNNFFCFNVHSVQAKTIISNENYNWNYIDNTLIQQLKRTRKTTEEFANSELDHCIDELMENVDHEFLDWYFNYLNQKAMEFGIPFAWLLFKLDEPLALFRSDDEKELNASQMIEKHFIGDFNRKFEKLVFNKEAEELLNKTLDRITRNYASSISMSFAMVKHHYQIPDQDWENHLNQIASLIYDTGTSKTNLSSDSFNSDLFTKVYTVVGVSIGTKLLVKTGQKIALKSSTKIAGKIGTLTLSTVAKFLDPILAVAFITWDTWDYKKMVAESRPQLRQNILDYFNQLKLSILDGSENSIMAGIDEIQNQLLYDIESLS